MFCLAGAAPDLVEDALDFLAQLEGLDGLAEERSGALVEGPAGDALGGGA